MSFPKVAGIALGAIAFTACATPQSIDIETAPPGAAISVDSEYIGRSPTQIDIEDIDEVRSLRIVAEKARHQPATKTVGKKPNGRFPEAVFLKLEKNQ